MNAPNLNEPPAADGQPGTASEGKANYVTGIADGNLTTPIGLRDFLFGIGVVFRLDRKRKKRPAKGGAESAGPKFRLPLVALARVLAPVAIASLAYAGYQRWSGEPLPQPVVGTWSTTDGRYAGRSFWLNPTAVAFQNGNATDQFSIHPIRRVKTRSVADTLYLSIDYEQEGQPITLSLAYHEARGPVLRLVNQPAIRWTRTGDAPRVTQ